jgi:hypothetical protein
VRQGEVPAPAAWAVRTVWGSWSGCRAGSGPGRIPATVSIPERSPEAEDRAVPGHREGAPLVAKRARSLSGTPHPGPADANREDDPAFALIA